jgi:2-keto-4-pentenoate hydratase/2-oxohepta-3-ene-1,7-dioic acid hydratase in catechol pathway
MNYVSFTTPDGTPTWGVAHEGKVYDLGASGARIAVSLKELVAVGRFGALAEQQVVDAPAFEEADVALLPPITDPGKILCIGVNYRSHQEETGKTNQKAPTVFTRFADTQMGHLSPALMPTSTTQYDYEGELALVISKDAYRVSAEEAWDYVAGYAPYNDFSVRDWQLAATQWTPGKNFPGTGAFGPYLVPADDLGDVDQLKLETRVNGEVRQSASVADLYFSIPQIIEYVTAWTKLSAGDVVVTGTPGGVGLFMDPKGFLSAGDVVEVEITGLGTLTNTVALDEAVG